MLTEKQQQARNLYFQTDLTKTQIAELLNISRRNLHYWIRENNWDRLKKSAVHLPAMMAENCYFIINKFTQSLLNECRIMTPITFKEADTLHKLALTIGKLKNHSTINETMEMFGLFIERINHKDPKLADQVMPFVNEYMQQRADIYLDHFKPGKMNEIGMYPEEEREDPMESQRDAYDEHIWSIQRDPESSIAKFFPQPFDADAVFPDTPVPKPEAPANTPTGNSNSEPTPPPVRTSEKAPASMPSPSNQERLPVDRQGGEESPSPQVKDSSADRHGTGEAFLARAKERILAGETFYDTLLPDEKETARRRALLDQGEEFTRASVEHFKSAPHLAANSRHKNRSFRK